MNMNLLIVKVNITKKMTKIRKLSLYLLVHLITMSFSISAQNKNSENLDKKCHLLLDKLETYQNLINDNDVVFIFLESFSTSNRSFLDYTSDEKLSFIENQNLDQSKLFNASTNVILYRRSAYLNFETQRQLEFKTWFIQFDFWIGKQLERNPELPKIIFLPTDDFKNLKFYFSTL